MPPIWKYQFDAETVTRLFMTNNMIGYIGITCNEVGENYLIGKMPVDERTKQSAGLLHGGANVTLAESIGSLAANLCIDQEKYYAVGLEINANHIRSVSSGWVFGKATPIHLGQSTQLWGIEIKDETGRLLCVVRHTIAVLEKQKTSHLVFNLPRL